MLDPVLYKNIIMFYHHHTVWAPKHEVISHHLMLTLLDLIGGQAASQNLVEVPSDAKLARGGHDPARRAGRVEACSREVALLYVEPHHVAVVET